MPHNILDLSNAYDDNHNQHLNPYDDDEPMYRLPASTRLLGGSSSKGSPQGIGWRETGSQAGKSPLKITQGLSSPYDDNDRGSSRDYDYTSKTPRSALALPPLDDRRYRPTTTSPQSSSSKPARNDDAEPFPVDPKTPYEVLGLSQYATKDDIKQKYKKLAKRYHPDLCRGGDEAKALATERFQLIGEAFAILGDPTRRAEYDRTQRERKKQRSSSSVSYSESKRPTFKSTFMPDPPVSSSRSRGTARSWQDQEDEPEHVDDLRDLDPFFLFSKMFPDFAEAMKSTMPRTSGSRSSSGLDSGFGVMNNNYEDQDQLSRHPFFGTGGSSNKDKRDKGFKMQENKSKAHVDRYGRLNVEQSNQSLKIHKSGGFTYESSSFTGSFGDSGGNAMGMIAAMMGGVAGGGGAMSMAGGGGAMSMAGGFPSFGGMMGGPSMPDLMGLGPAGPPARARRSSLGSFGGGFGDDIGSSLNAPPPFASASLSRRPSLGMDSSFDMPRAQLTSSSRPGTPSSRQLTSFGAGDRSLSNFNGGYGGW